MSERKARYRVKSAKGERPDLNQLLADQIAVSDLPQPVREYRIPGPRKFVFDFAWPTPPTTPEAPVTRLLVEVQGGIWMKNKSGHSSGVGLSRDFSKGNYSTILGWRLLHFSPQDVRSGKALDTIRQALAPTPGCVVQPTLA